MLCLVKTCWQGASTACVGRKSPRPLLCLATALLRAARGGGMPLVREKDMPLVHGMINLERLAHVRLVAGRRST